MRGELRRKEILKTKLLEKSTLRIQNEDENMKDILLNRNKAE